VNTMQIIGDFIFVIGGTFFVRGLIGFLRVNSSIIKNKAVLSVFFGLPMVSILGGTLFFFNKQLMVNNAADIKTALLLIAAVLFAEIILNSIVRDFFQPLSLSNETCIFLIAGVAAVLVTDLLGLLLKTNSYLSVIMPAAIILAMIIGITWAKTQKYGNFSNISGEPLFLFENGEEDYKTFRIPSLIVLEKDVLNAKYDYSFQNDILLATAEARRNSSKDTGEIDLVGKLSSDGGKSWTALTVFFTDETLVCKFGNPTPVFDNVTGVINFILCGDSNGSENIQGILNEDLTITWGEHIPLKRVSADNSGGETQTDVTPGPGKSIQLCSGRLLVPCNNNGDSLALYSDDDGLTWKTGEPAAKGNECEAVELNNGELMMVSRESTPCSQYHPRQYQRLSYSNDGGETWYSKSESTWIKTPVCMSSLAKTSDGTVWFSHPDCFLTRANLSVAASLDNGKHWDTKMLYPGPSGYSCITADSSDTVYVFAEVGKVNYNEALVFLTLNNPEST